MQRNTQQLREDSDRILAGMESTGQDGIDADEEREPDTAIPYAAQEEPGTVHVHEFTDAYVLDLPDRLIVFPKQEPLEEEEGVIDTTLAGAPATQEPQPPQGKEHRGSWLAYTPVSIVLLLVLFSFLHVLFFPPLAHISLILKSQEVSATTTLQTGRILAPLTLSQSASVPATGRGHQDAAQATGYITFYNASFSSQTVNAGTALTGADGVQVITDRTVTIPADNPPVNGQATVSAHAINAGSAGNIQALDINGTISSSLFVKNLNAFTGGQDERNFQFVTKSDIENTAIPLKAAVSQSVTAALQAQLKDNEQLQSLPCAPQVSADHQINEEATSVKVTATLTCSAVAYNQNTLQQQATALLTTQAFKKLGPGYSLLGTIQVTVTHAIPTHTIPTLVLSLTGTWTYALSNAAQQRVKDLVKGKTYQEALHILRSLPGIEKASLAWDKHTKLPEDPQDIHLLLISGI